MITPVTFSLKPFGSVAETTNLAIIVTVARKQNVLSLSYVLKGDLGKVAIPDRSENACRKDRLWEQTCFEFFIVEGTHHTRTDPYWEFNLSPSGDWNVFALGGYRQGLQEENGFFNYAGIHRDSDECNLFRCFCRCRATCRCVCSRCGWA